MGVIMNKLSKKGLNKLIFRYSMEIIFLVTLIILSYGAFTSNNLSASASIAASSSMNRNDLQILYGRDNDDLDAVLSCENLLDRGTLTIKNTNNDKISVNIVLSIESTEIDLEKYKFEFGGTQFAFKEIKKSGDSYELNFGNITISPYDTFKSTFSIYGDPFASETFTYNFKVLESFYE